MADQGDNKDALLDKLDSLMKSGRARKQLDPPPLLTDAIPDADESSIPTLTDAVEIPDKVPKQRDNPVDTPQDTSIDYEPDTPVDAPEDTPIEFQSDASEETPQEGPVDVPDDTPIEFQSDASQETPQDASVDVPEDAPIDFQDDTPVELQEQISSRLLAAIEREMQSLSNELADPDDKLGVLHRSIRYALPELVRLRWLESPGTDPDTDGSDEDEPEQ